MELFVTCGSGLERFAITELRDKFNIKVNCEEESGRRFSFPGKLLFKTGNHDHHDPDSSRNTDKVVGSNKPGNGEIEDDNILEEMRLVQDITQVQNLIQGLKSVERLLGLVVAEDSKTLSLLGKRHLLTALYQISSRPELKKLLNRWASIIQVQRVVTHKFQFSN